MTVRSPRRSVVPITTPTFSPPSYASFYRKIAYTFFALTACILIGILWLSSVQATVTVHVRRTPVRSDGTVDISAHPSGGADQIPGRVLHLPIRKTQEFEVRGLADTAAVSSTGPSIDTTTTDTSLTPSTTSSATAPTAGSSTGYAKGTVTIVNSYSKAQTLVEKTRLLTSDGKLFRLDHRVAVPAGGRATVTVTADQPGDSSAVAPTKFTIPGLWIDLQKLIYAESTNAFTIKSGDGTVSIPVATPKPKMALAPTPSTAASSTQSGDRRIVTQQNIDDAYQTLTDQVVTQAKQTLAASITDARLNGVAYFVNTTAKSATVHAGQVASAFSAQVDVEVIAVFYSDDDMQSLIRSRLHEHLPDGQEFLPFTDQDFIYTLESVDKDAETARLRVIANAEYRPTATNPALGAAAIAGKSKDEAMQQIKQIDGVDSVDVVLRPGWIGKIPRLTDHIKVNVE